MNYIDEMFNRAETQHLASFLISGGENLMPEKGAYKERIEKTERLFEECLNDCKLDKEIKKKIYDKYLICVSNLEDVFTELGIKLSARLFIDLLNYHGN